MEHQLPTAGRGIDALRHARKAHAHCLQLLDNLDQVLERAPQPVEPPDRERVARAQHFQQSEQLGPVGLAAGLLLFVDTLTPGVDQGVSLKVEVLVVGADAGVADSHNWKLSVDLEALAAFGTLLMPSVYQKSTNPLHFETLNSGQVLKQIASRPAPSGFQIPSPFHCVPKTSVFGTRMLCGDFTYSVP